MLALQAHSAGPGRAIPIGNVDPAEIAAYQAAIASGSLADLPRAQLKLWRPDVLREPSTLVQHQEGGQHGGLDSDRPQTSPGKTPRRPQVVAPALDIAPAQRTLNEIGKASGRLQSDIGRCEPNSPFEEVADCLWLALSYYATSLSSPNIEVPEQLKQIPKIVVRTARAVRTAGSAQSALEAVEQGVSDIRKQIELLQVADDSATANLVVRAGDLIAASLDSVADKLRQVEL